MIKESYQVSHESDGTLSEHIWEYKDYSVYDNSPDDKGHLVLYSYNKIDMQTEV